MAGLRQPPLYPKALPHGHTAPRSNSARQQHTHPDLHIQRALSAASASSKSSHFAVRRFVGPVHLTHPIRERQSLTETSSVGVHGGPLRSRPSQLELASMRQMAPSADFLNQRADRDQPEPLATMSGIDGRVVDDENRSVYLGVEPRTTSWVSSAFPMVIRSPDRTSRASQGLSHKRGSTSTAATRPTTVDSSASFPYGSPGCAAEATTAQRLAIRNGRRTG